MIVGKNLESGHEYSPRRLEAIAKRATKAGAILATSSVTALGAFGCSTAKPEGNTAKIKQCADIDNPNYSTEPVSDARAEQLQKQGAKICEFNDRSLILHPQQP